MEYLNHNQQIVDFEDGNNFYPHLPSGAFILLICPRTGRVLLGKRHSESEYQPNTWFGFGGHCETEETPAYTAIREMEEEAKIFPTDYKLSIEPVYIDVNIDSSGVKHTIYVYIGTVENELQPTLNDEHIDAKWLKFSQLSQLNLFSTLIKIFTDIESISKVKFFLFNDNSL
jgi:8-oxo-dGTP pyrophosphatase MutT (NUDIX family)